MEGYSIYGIESPLQMSLFPNNWDLDIPLDEQVIKIVKFYTYPIYIYDRIQEGSAAIKNVEGDVAKYYRDIKYTKGCGRACSEIYRVLLISCLDSQGLY